MYVRSGGLWHQQAYIKASNTGVNHGFGRAVSLSADGSTLAVGASRENSAATGINGDQSDNTVVRSGAVYVYVRNNGLWQQQSYLKANNTGASDHFGWAISLSAEGNTLAVGARHEGNDSGAVYVFSRSGGIWQQHAYLKASNTDGGDRFGEAVSLSADGNTLAVGAIGESSTATGIDGNQSDNSANESGAAYVYIRSGGIWQQKAYLKAGNTGQSDFFGKSISLSADASTLAVGASLERSAATGINGDQDDNSAPASGAVYIY